MNILHVITTIENGGAENQLLKLTYEQVVSGNKVTVLFLKGNPYLKKNFEDQGVKVNQSIANLPFFIQLFRKRTLGIDSDVIHLHLPRSEVVFCIMSLRIPLIITRHNSESFFPYTIINKNWVLSNLSSLFSRYLTKRARVVIAISESVKNFLLSKAEVCAETKIKVVYYGTKNLELSEQNYEAYDNKKRNQSITIGTISRLVNQKDLPTLIAGFDIFSKKIDQTKLEIIGGGYLEKKLKKQVKEIKREKEIKFLGKMEKPWVTASNWQIFVMSSKYEGFGLVLLEAMQLGIPVVLTRISTFVEVMGPEYPYFFKPGSYLDLNSVLLNVMNTNFDFKIYYQHRLKKFSIFNSSSQILKIYNDSLVKG